MMMSPRASLAGTLFLVVLLFSCSSSYAKPADSNQWDFMLYVTQWPGSVDQSTVPSGVDSFTLHGVWPTNNDTSYPSYCSGPSFSMSAIQSLETQLDENWPSLTGGQGNEDFWSHEWEKHGTCATNGQAPGLTDELSFFTFALALHSQFNSKQALANAGITPSNSATYSSKDILSALQNAFGYTPLISCQSSDKVSGYSAYELETIQWCVDYDGIIFECAQEFYDKSNEDWGCGDGSKILYPPMEYSS